MYVSGLLQAAALDVVTQPGWHTHLRSLRQQVRARRDLLSIAWPSTSQRRTWTTFPGVA